MGVFLGVLREGQTGIGVLGCPTEASRLGNGHFFGLAMGI